MRVWSDLVYDSAIAKTKGTFDAIDTNQAQVKIAQPEAKSILGFLVCYVSGIPTSGEPTPSIILEVTSKALGISSQHIAVALPTNDAVATTNTPGAVKTVYVPFKQPSNKKSIFNADLSFKASPSATTTGGVDIIVAVLYSDSEPDTQFGMELMAQMHRRVTGGAFAADAAKAHATGGTAVTLTAISIPTGATELLGIFNLVSPNAAAAEDGIIGFMEFSSPGIPNFSPQLWPNCVSWQPPLGTAIGVLVGEAGRYYPTRFPLTGAETTVNVSSTLLEAAGNAPDTLQALIYDQN